MLPIFFQNLSEEQPNSPLYFHLLLGWELPRVLTYLCLLLYNRVSAPAREVNAIKYLERLKKYYFTETPVREP